MTDIICDGHHLVWCQTALNKGHDLVEVFVSQVSHGLEDTNCLKQSHLNDTDKGMTSLPEIYFINLNPPIFNSK